MSSKSRAGKKRRCEVQDGCNEMVSNTTFYKHRLQGCKRQRIDNDNAILMILSTFFDKFWMQCNQNCNEVLSFG